MTGQHFPETGLNTSKIVRLVTVYLTGKPTYSPDGRSHTLLSNTSLIIWDIQTGGVPKNLKVATRTMFLQCGRWMGEQLAPSNQDRYADTRYAMNIHDVAPATSFPLAHSSQAYLCRPLEHTHAGRLSIPMGQQHIFLGRRDDRVG